MESFEVENMLSVVLVRTVNGSDAEPVADDAWGVGGGHDGGDALGGGRQSESEVADAHSSWWSPSNETWPSSPPPSPSPALCGSADAANSSLAWALKFYGQGVSVAVMGALGLVGNVLAIVTIASMHKTKLFYKLLVLLALFDVAFILTGGLFIIQMAFKFSFTWYFLMFPTIIYPVAGISMTGSTYTCLSIAAERFLGICHPNMDTRLRKFRFYVVAILSACVVIDAPRFFEVETIWEEGADGSLTAVGMGYTALRTNPTFIITYVMWYRLLTTILIPFVLMLFFNIKVFYYYKRNSLQGHDGSLLTIFACITFTFFLCHFPRVILNVYEFHLHTSKHVCETQFRLPFHPPEWVIVATHIEKILLILNASANFVYYCFSGREFRLRFCHGVLGCRRLRHHGRYRGGGGGQFSRNNTLVGGGSVYYRGDREAVLSRAAGGVASAASAATAGTCVLANSSGAGSTYSSTRSRSVFAGYFGGNNNNSKGQSPRLSSKRGSYVMHAGGGGGGAPSSSSSARPAGGRGPPASPRDHGGLNGNLAVASGVVEPAFRVGAIVLTNATAAETDTLYPLRRAPSIFSDGSLTTNQDSEECDDDETTADPFEDGGGSQRDGRQDSDCSRV